MRAALLALVLLAGCASVLKAAGYPPEATRKTPPTGVEDSALKVGAVAPDVSVPLTDGTSAALRGSRTALLFYRGSW
jgi:hypothetical protein